MKVMVDDLRVDHGRMDLVCRSAEVAISVVNWKSVTELWLDHDLGEDRQSGYDLLKHLNACSLIPPIVVFLTSNPVGRENFRGILESNLYSMSYDPDRDWAETWRAPNA